MNGPELEIKGILALRGRIRPPGDKSIAHRSLLLSARAEGTSRITGLPWSQDVVHTLEAVEALGAEVRRRPEPDATEVSGGAGSLHRPVSSLDVGNSGTAIRLLAGFVSPFPWLTHLHGDASIARRPMDRVVDPLRLMGAGVDGRENGRFPPLAIAGGRLRGIDYTPPIASAQVKSAILLAGLGAEGETVVREPMVTRVHTEEMLAGCGANVEVSSQGGGQVVRVRPSRLEPFELAIPGDPSQAAFWVVAACIVPGSDVVVENVYVGPARAGYLDVLTRMGAEVEMVKKTATTGDISARYGPLRATEVGGSEIPGVIDEIPVLSVAAAVAEGTTTFKEVAELAVKESNRLATVESELSSLGIEVETGPDSLVVHGGALKGGPT
ncbi:MAG: 3-phosphoshikimate 1-carboxyvinyltransferase, partial [Acidimicrobiales bacterium]